MAMCDVKTTADVREESRAADDHVALVTITKAPDDEQAVSNESLLITQMPNNELKQVTSDVSVHVSDGLDTSSAADCENNNQTITAACSVLGTTVEKTPAECSLLKCSELILTNVGITEHKTNESQTITAAEDAKVCTTKMLVNGDSPLEAANHTVNGCVEDEKVHTSDVSTGVLLEGSNQQVETALGFNESEKKLDSGVTDGSICPEVPSSSHKVSCDTAENIASQTIAATSEQSLSMQNSVIQVSGPVTSSCSSLVPLPVRACHILPSLPQLASTGKRLSLASVTLASDKMPLQRTTLPDMSVSSSLPVPLVISQSVSQPLSSTTLSSPSLLVGSTVVRTDGVQLPILNSSTRQETIDPNDTSHTASSYHEGEKKVIEF